MEAIDAIVTAGGRISGPYAEAVGSTVKAMARLEDVPVVCRVLHAVRETPGVRRVCVVGPPEVRDLLDGDYLWQEEADSALGNVLTGLARLGESPSDRVLLCGSDLPTLNPEALEDFLRRAPEDADVCMPAVYKERFLEAFPGSGNIYVRLAEGEFTGGSQFLIRVRALRENGALIRELFEQRKSQVGMVRTLGVRLIWKFLTRRLSVRDIEARLSQLTRFRCRAVMGASPYLAFDIDHLEDYRYIQGWLGKNR